MSGQVLRDQSSYSSWYFIERAYIGEINANVTIALTSSVLTGAGKGQEGGDAPQEHAAGLFRWVHITEDHKPLQALTGIVPHFSHII